MLHWIFGVVGLHTHSNCVLGIGDKVLANLYTLGLAACKDCRRLTIHPHLTRWVEGLELKLGIFVATHLDLSTQIVALASHALTSVGRWQRHHLPLRIVIRGCWPILHRGDIVELLVIVELGYIWHSAVLLVAHKAVERNLIHSRLALLSREAHRVHLATKGLVQWELHQGLLGRRQEHTAALQIAINLEVFQSIGSHRVALIAHFGLCLTILKSNLYRAISLACESDSKPLGLSRKPALNPETPVDRLDCRGCRSTVQQQLTTTD